MFFLLIYRWLILQLHYDKFQILLLISIFKPTLIVCNFILLNFIIKGHEDIQTKKLCFIVDRSLNLKIMLVNEV